MKKIAIIIPCHNEELGIEKVVKGVPVKKLKSLGYETQILVVDNKSTDNTAKIAKKSGATVIHEPRRGKGNALRAGFRYLSDSTDYVIMLDGDNTYKPKEIPRLIEPLDSGFCDVIVGSRLGGKVNPGALKFTNRLVNWGYAFLVRQFYGANITDVLSGFFAWKRGVIDGMVDHLTSDGFTIEMEMITKIVKMGYEIYSVPITYDPRDGTSKISAFKDGSKILGIFFKNIFWSHEKDLHRLKMKQITQKDIKSTNF